MQLKIPFNAFNSIQQNVSRHLYCIDRPKKIIHNVGYKQHRFEHPKCIYTSFGKIRKTERQAVLRSAGMTPSIIYPSPNVYSNRLIGYLDAEMGKESGGGVGKYVLK